jgi:serine/threonine protein phosphatase PrpC
MTLCCTDSRGGKAIRLTVDHKASLPEEAKRITDAGGFVGRNRVNGVLAVSRALGDHMLKENDVVTAVPYCQETELTDEDSFLVLACDGVWDVITDQEAVDFVLQKAEATLMNGACTCVCARAYVCGGWGMHERDVSLTIRSVESNRVHCRRGCRCRCRCRC